MKIISLESLKSLYYRATFQLRDFEALFEHKRQKAQEAGAVASRDIQNDKEQDDAKELKEICELFNIDPEDSKKYKNYLINRV